MVSIAALLALVFLPPVAAAPPPRLEDLLSLAGRYVVRLEEELAILVAEETHTQSVFAGQQGSVWQSRALVSDVAWVPTGDPFVWAFFRDVREVDGDPVRDREERLAHLFPSGATLAGTERARQRFAFRLDGHDERQGAPTWRVRFSERARPTLARESRGRDVPARGLLWLEAAGAALVESRLELRPPGLGPIVIETDYARDDRLAGWLPTQMRESYGIRSRSSREPRLEAVARYSGWRRAQVEVQVILPVR